MGERLRPHKEKGTRGMAFFFFGGGSEAAPQPRCLPLTLLRARCRRLLTEEQKHLYTKVAQYCNRSTDLIPISFVLGTGPSPAPSQLGDAPSGDAPCPNCPIACGWVALSTQSHRAQLPDPLPGLGMSPPPSLRTAVPGEGQRALYPQPVPPGKPPGPPGEGSSPLRAPCATSTQVFTSP